MEYIVQNPRGSLIGKKVVPAQRGADIALECGELFWLETRPQGQAVLVMEGSVWLTESGNKLDIILRKDQTYSITGRQLLLLQGLPAARIRIVSSS